MRPKALRCLTGRAQPLIRDRTTPVPEIPHVVDLALDGKVVESRGGMESG